MNGRRPTDVWWLRSLPAHWTTEPVKSRFDLRRGKMVDAAKATGTQIRPYLGNVNVRWDCLDLEDVAEVAFTSELRSAICMIRRTGGRRREKSSGPLQARLEEHIARTESPAQ